MKWSDEKIKQLEALAKGGVPNKEIALALSVTIDDVYAKRSQLGITMPKIAAAKGKPAITVNPDFEAAVADMEKALPQKAPRNRYVGQAEAALRVSGKKEKMGENTASNLLFFWVLEQFLKLADESIKSVELTSEGKTIIISYKKGGQKIANIECDSNLAIIAGVVKVCLR